ncbi:hypothetical protein KIN20_002236 [Parelaphostrongylus tenuis]|uniref:Uncharacterized protein n=1 Tax=Parelaphostrongylus tenuis TaxID=148309 RepID=A0AAD5MDW8_PARTN|nr:hypothetical protein KIN20_002236 [Parelaphostrongylus tenuis]
MARCIAVDEDLNIAVIKPVSINRRLSVLSKTSIYSGRNCEHHSIGNQVINQLE